MIWNYLLEEINCLVMICHANTERSHQAAQATGYELYEFNMSLLHQVGGELKAVCKETLVDNIHWKIIIFLKNNNIEEYKCLMYIFSDDADIGGDDEMSEGTPKSKPAQQPVGQYQQCI